MLKDHEWGRKLIKDLRSLYEQISDAPENIEITFRIFTRRLFEFAWHSRRHIEEENSFVIPLAADTFTDDSAETRRP